MAAKTAARTTHTTTRVAQPIIVRAPSAPTRGKRAGALAKKGASKVAKAAYDRKHKLVALAAAGVLGYARREGMLDNVPGIDAIGPEGNLALAAQLIAEFTGSTMADHVATGLGSVAINRMAAGDIEGGGTHTP